MPVIKHKVKKTVVKNKSNSDPPNQQNKQVTQNQQNKQNPPEQNKTKAVQQDNAKGGFNNSSNNSQVITNPNNETTGNNNNNNNNNGNNNKAGNNKNTKTAGNNETNKSTVSETVPKVINDNTQSVPTISTPMTTPTTKETPTNKPVNVQSTNRSIDSKKSKSSSFNSTALGIGSGVVVLILGLLLFLFLKKRKRNKKNKKETFSHHLNLDKSESAYQIDSGFLKVDNNITLPFNEPKPDKAYYSNNGPILDKHVLEGNIRNKDLNINYSNIGRIDNGNENNVIHVSSKEFLLAEQKNEQLLYDKNFNANGNLDSKNNNNVDENYVNAYNNYNNYNYYYNSNSSNSKASSINYNSNNTDVSSDVNPYRIDMKFETPTLHIAFPKPSHKASSSLSNSWFNYDLNNESNNNNNNTNTNVYYNNATYPSSLSEVATISNDIPEKTKPRYNTPKSIESLRQTVTIEDTKILENNSKEKPIKANIRYVTNNIIEAPEQLKATEEINYFDEKVLGKSENEKISGIDGNDKNVEIPDHVLVLEEIVNQDPEVESEIVKSKISNNNTIVNDSKELEKSIEKQRENEMQMETETSTKSKKETEIETEIAVEPENKIENKSEDRAEVEMVKEIQKKKEPVILIENKILDESYAEAKPPKFTSLSNIKTMESRSSLSTSELSSVIDSPSQSEKMSYIQQDNLSPGRPVSMNKSPVKSYINSPVKTHINHAVRTYSQSPVKTYINSPEVKYERTSYDHSLSFNNAVSRNNNVKESSHDYNSNNNNSLEVVNNSSLQRDHNLSKNSIEQLSVITATTTTATSTPKTNNSLNHSFSDNCNNSINDVSFNNIVVDTTYDSFEEVLSSSPSLSRANTINSVATAGTVASTTTTKTAATVATATTSVSNITNLRVPPVLSAFHHALPTPPTPKSTRFFGTELGPGQGMNEELIVPDVLTDALGGRDIYNNQIRSIAGPYCTLRRSNRNKITSPLGNDDLSSNGNAGAVGSNNGNLINGSGSNLNPNFNSLGRHISLKRDASLGRKVSNHKRNRSQDFTHGSDKLDYVNHTKPTYNKQELTSFKDLEKETNVSNDFNVGLRDNFAASLKGPAANTMANSNDTFNNLNNLHYSKTLPRHFGSTKKEVDFEKNASTSTRKVSNVLLFNKEKTMGTVDGQDKRISMEADFIIQNANVKLTCFEEDLLKASITGKDTSKDVNSVLYILREERKLLDQPCLETPQ